MQIYYNGIQVVVPFFGLRICVVEPEMIRWAMSNSQDTLIQLKHSQESLEFALQSGRMGTWDINLGDDTVICSKEMLELWGVVPEHFKYQRSMLQSKVHPEDVDVMKFSIDLAIKTGTVYELEYRIIPSPGVVKWVQSRGRCTFEKESKTPVRFSGVVYDITEKKMKQEALDKATKARDQFFMIASHELRTPLTCLELQLQVMEWDLKNKYPDEFSAEKIEQNLKKQREHLSRITRIMDNILDESRISHGKLPMHIEEFDLSEMVLNILGEFRLTAETAGVTVQAETQKDLLGSWDRFRLEQALLNLLTNALRYGNKNPIFVQVKGNDKTVTLTVKDQGIGIKPEDHDRVFDRFERANSDNEGNGMGLGLFISKNIVKDHGGEIRLKSEFGKGSEFHIILPRK
jgi:PAS domain S-box-containing protein